jgi:hypothetical protein
MEETTDSKHLYPKKPCELTLLSKPGLPNWLHEHDDITIKTYDKWELICVSCTIIHEFVDLFMKVFNLANTDIDETLLDTDRSDQPQKKEKKKRKKRKKRNRKNNPAYSNVNPNAKCFVPQSMRSGSGNDKPGSNINAVCFIPKTSNGHEKHSSKVNAKSSKSKRNGRGNIKHGNNVKAKRGNPKTIHSGSGSSGNEKNDSKSYEFHIRGTCTVANAKELEEILKHKAEFTKIEISSLSD